MSSIQSITDDISKHSEEYTERSAFESMDFGKSGGISANYTWMELHYHRYGKLVHILLKNVKTWWKDLNNLLKTSSINKY